MLDAQTFTYGDLQYTVNEDGFSATVASNQNFSDYTMAVLNIPQTVVYEGVSLEVTAIGDGAFNSHHDIFMVGNKKSSSSVIDYDYRQRSVLYVYGIGGDKYPGEHDLYWRSCIFGLRSVEIR